jgi:hypothetical protein
VPIVDDFTAELARLSLGADLDATSVPVLMTKACARVLYVDGASLSLLSENVRMPMGADSPAADAAERMQFTLGEGPCLEVYATRQAGVFPQPRIEQHWPVYAAEFLQTTPFRSCASLPLDLGDGLMAALDLYLEDPAGPSDTMMSDAASVAEEITLALILSTLRSDPDRGPDWLRGQTMISRANLWVAIALLTHHEPASTADTVALLRSYAYGLGLTLDEVTQALAALTLDPRVVLG